MAIPIAAVVKECVKAFKRVIAAENHGGLPIDALEDEFGRFRIWAGNVSAHTTGRRSLEYRLRDSSELATAVISYLRKLRDTLTEIDEPSSSLGGASSPELEDSDSQLFADADLGDGAPASLLIEDIAMINSSLLRISSALRNPARKDQIRYADDVNTRYFEPYDIDHVQSKFPLMSEELSTRLGRAISRHRQFLRYHEEHHNKLKAGLDDFDEIQTIVQGPSTVATSVHKYSEAPMPSIDDNESVHTATSYALTESGDTALVPPPWPESGREGAPFECPLCFYVISTVDERAWIQHVYEDIPPFVCTFEHCDAITRQFARRRDWLHHMKEHAMYWACPTGCSASLASPRSFEHHLQTLHPEILSITPLAGLLISCAKETTTPPSSKCPLCAAEKPTMLQMYKHIGRHLEQLALFSIPQHILGDFRDEISDNDTSEDQLDAASLEDQDPEIVHAAFTYLDRVKLQFVDRPEITNGLYSILKDFRSGMIDTPSCISRVCTILAGFPELIQEFGTFLPRGYILEARGGSESYTVRATTPDGTEILARSADRTTSGEDVPAAEEVQSADQQSLVTDALVGLTKATQSTREAAVAVHNASDPGREEPMASADLTEPTDRQGLVLDALVALTQSAAHDEALLHQQQDESIGRTHDKEREEKENEEGNKHERTRLEGLVKYLDLDPAALTDDESIADESEAESSSESLGPLGFETRSKVM